MQIAQLQIVEDSKLETLLLVLQENPTAQIIKYSPEKRCLLRIEKENKIYFVKVYPKKFLKQGRGEKIHAVGAKLWQFLIENKINFEIPKPFCWDQRTQTIWQEKLNGETADDFPARSGGVSILFEIGKGVADISKLEITPPRFFDRSEQLKDSREFAEKILKSAPPLKLKIEMVLRRLEKATLPTEKLVPIHGDMHLGQWLFDGEKIGLLDFEDFSLGEVERDLASFIVQLENEYPQIGEDYKNSFLEGFRASGGLESAELMKFYMAHKWLAKASKGEERLEELLDKALQCLEFIR